MLQLVARVYGTCEPRDSLAVRLSVTKMCGCVVVRLFLFIAYFFILFYATVNYPY